MLGKLSISQGRFGYYEEEDSIGFLCRGVRGLSRIEAYHAQTHLSIKPGQARPGRAFLLLVWFSIIYLGLQE